MKKRYLRRPIQTVLEAITFLLVMFVAMIDDFTMEFLPTMLTILVVLALNTYVLARYSRP